MMQFRKKAFFLACFLSLSLLNAAHAQNTRLNDHNNIGWYVLNGVYKLNPKMSIQGEYQWRRDDFVTSWQQSLLRFGFGYQLLPNVQLQAGAAWIETYNYGEIPLNGFGKQFPEYRLHEQAVLTQNAERVEISHRFRLEQRWVGKFNTVESEKPESFIYTNRLRYMLRLQCPLQGKTLDDHEFYAAVYDELFIGFGKNVGENIFDQNRLAILGGYRFNKHFRLEGGYFSQTLQLGREVNNRNVLQYNEGFILSLNITAGKMK